MALRISEVSPYSKMDRPEIIFNRLWPAHLTEGCDNHGK